MGSEYADLQVRYMAALNLQYTAFKEMLLAETHGNTMPISGIEKRSEGSEIFYDTDPSFVSEAYLFMPLGYWPSVYDNTMYPSDFPTDLMMSMSSGASTVIAGTYTDGDYLMLFCVDNSWKKAEFSISNGKLIRINEYYPERYTKQDFHYNLGNAGIGMEIDVRPTYHDEIWGEMTVVRHEKTGMSTDLTVANSKAANLQSDIIIAVKNQNQLASEMFVWFKKTDELHSAIDVVYGSKIPSSITVMNRRERAIESELIVMNYNSNGIASEMTVKNHKDKNLPGDISVANEQSDALPAEVDIKNERTSDLDTEITVKRWMNAFLASEISIRENANIGIDNEIYVRGVKKNDIDSAIDITSKCTETHICSDIAISNIDRQDLESSITILAQNHMDSAMNAACAKWNEIPSDIVVLERESINVPVELFVINDFCMEAVASSIEKGHGDIDSSIEISNPCNSDMATTIYVNVVPQKMRVTATGAQYYIDAIETEFTVVENSTDSLLSEITISFNNIMEARFEGPQYQGQSVLNADMIVACKQNSNMESSICILAANRMKTAIDAISGGCSDIMSDIFVVRKRENTLPVEMVVNATNRMETISFNKNTISADIQSEIIIGTQSDIAAELYITDKASRMEVHGKTFPNRIHTESDVPVKDATGTSFTPSKNYGSIEDIYAGKLRRAAAYRSTIGFDLSKMGIDRDPSYDYFKYEGIQKATLRLYLNRPTQDEVEIKVYQIPYEWQEMEITYRDMMAMPTDAYLGKFKAPHKTGTIDIDVTDVFKDWNNKPNQCAFMLVVDDLQAGRQAVSFSSREGKYAPKLIIEHYDAADNADVIDISSEIEIRPYSYINSEITIEGAPSSGIETTLVIFAGSSTNDLPSELDIDALKIIVDDMPSEIEPAHWNRTTEVSTEITPNHWKQESALGSEIVIERDYSKGIRVYII